MPMFKRNPPSKAKARSNPPLLAFLRPFAVVLWVYLRLRHRVVKAAWRK